MASQEPGGPDTPKLEALAKQLADLERQAADMGATFQSSGRTRLLLVLAVVVILGVSLTMFWKRASGFLKEPEPLVNAMRKSYEDNQGDLEREIRTLWDHSRPKLQEAFTKQIETDMPIVMTKIGEERETLAVNLRDRLEGEVRGQYNKAIDQHRQILQENFPSIKDEKVMDDMAQNFKDAFDPLVKRHYSEKIKGEFNKMYAIWDDFPMDKSKRTREELGEELYGLLFGLMQEKLAGAGKAEKKPERTDAPAPAESGSSDKPATESTDKPAAESGDKPAAGSSDKPAAESKSSGS